MMPEMRRKDRALTQEQSIEVIERGAYGVLSSTDCDNQCYGTPMSYIFMDNKIYFHCATVGQKLRNIAHNPKVCFTIVTDVEPVFSNGDFSTFYSSVMIFGNAKEVTDTDVKTKMLVDLCERYLPEHAGNAAEYVVKMLARTCVVEIDVEHLTGKSKHK